MTRYARGTAFENKVKGLLISDSYYVIRSAGSKGACDLVALKPGQVLMIQVKKTNPLLPRAERIELVRVAQHVRGLPVVAYQPVPRKPVQYRLLTGYEPSQWLPFDLDEVGAA